MLRKKICVVIASVLCFVMIACGIGQVNCTVMAKEQISAEQAESTNKYADASNWAFLSETSDKTVDVFFISPTVFLGDGTHFNMDIGDANLRYQFAGAMYMEKGIYDGVGNFYAPFYQQASLATYKLNEAEGAPYFDIAYKDVKEAFDYYMAHFNQGKPFIIAGFSQGAHMSLRLLKEEFDNQRYQDKLVAAYLIGGAVTQEDLTEYPHLKMAQGEKDYGCIISFNSENEDINTSIIVPHKTLGINPLNWKTDNTVATAAENIGACFTNYSGAIMKEIPELCGGYLDPIRGTLKVTGVTPKEYPPALDIFAPGVYHIYDYQFFYRNLQKNVAVRTQEYLKNK